MAISFILIITVIPKDHQVCSHYLPKEEAGGMGFQLPEKKNTKLNGLKTFIFSQISYVGRA